MRSSLCSGRMRAADIICETATCAKPALTRSTLPRVGCVERFHRSKDFATLRPHLLLYLGYYGLFAHTMATTTLCNDQRPPAANEQPHVRKEERSWLLCCQRTYYLLLARLVVKQTNNRERSHQPFDDQRRCGAFVRGWVADGANA